MLCLLLLALPAAAQEEEDPRDRQIEELRRIVEQQGKQIEALRQVVEELRGEKAPEGGVPGPEPPGWRSPGWPLWAGTPRSPPR